MSAHAHGHVTNAQSLLLGFVYEGRAKGEWCRMDVNGEEENGLYCSFFSPGIDGMSMLLF